MSVTRLPAWNVTAFEIALDLQSDGFIGADTGRFGAASPRICLLAGFALTPQLKRVIAAVDRTIPARLPREIRVVPAKTRGGPAATGAAFSIQPLLALIRLQLRFARAIEPGLAEGAASNCRSREDRRTYVAIRTRFHTFKNASDFRAEQRAGRLRLGAIKIFGITVYRLGSRAEPQSILGHWTYVKSTRSSVHLPSGP